MEQDRLNQIKANSVHVDDNFNTLLNAVNGKLDLDGTSVPTANISMGSHKITNIATPTASGDAATKGYVDSSITSATKIATASQLGQVKIGTNINVNSSGVISVNDATTGQKGVIQLGRTNTTAKAAVSAVRNTVITNSIPSTGTDGVIYFVYSA